MMRRLICCGLIVVVVVALGGCGGGDGQSQVARVGPNGFDISVGSAHVSAGPGVAPDGTVVEVTVTNGEGSLPDVPHLTSASKVVEVSLSGGREQPHVPVSIAVPVAASVDVKAKLAAGDLPVIVAKSATGDVELLDAHWDSDAETLTAQTTHLSGFFAAFVEAGKALESARQFIDALLGQRFPKPECASKASDAGTDYVVSPVSDTAAWPCISVRDGHIVLSLHSNSGQVYRVRTEPGAPGNTTTGLDVANMVMEAIYHRLYSSSRDIEGLLPPGGSVEFGFATSAPPSKGELAVEPVLLYVKVLMLVVNIFSTASTSLGKGAEDAEVVDCVGGLADTWKGIDVKHLIGSLGQNLKAVSGCLGPVMVAAGQSLVAGTIIGLIISGVSVLTTMVQGLVNSIAELFGQHTANDATFTVTTSGTAPEAGPVATFDGYGPVRIGMTRAEATKVMGQVTRDDFVGCTVLDTNGPNAFEVWISDTTDRVGKILTPAGTVTDRGVGDGSTAAEIRAAYSDPRFTIDEGLVAGQRTSGINVYDGPKYGDRLLAFSLADDRAGPPSIGLPPLAEGC